MKTQVDIEIWMQWLLRPAIIKFIRCAAVRLHFLLRCNFRLYDELFGDFDLRGFLLEDLDRLLHFGLLAGQLIFQTVYFLLRRYDWTMRRCGGARWTSLSVFQVSAFFCMPRQPSHHCSSKLLARTNLETLGNLADNDCLGFPKKAGFFSRTVVRPGTQLHLFRRTRLQHCSRSLRSRTHTMLKPTVLCWKCPRSGHMPDTKCQWWVLHASYNQR